MSGVQLRILCLAPRLHQPFNTPQLDVLFPTSHRRRLQPKEPSKAPQATTDRPAEGLEGPGRRTDPERRPEGSARTEPWRRLEARRRCRLEVVEALLVRLEALEVLVRLEAVEALLELISVFVGGDDSRGGGRRLEVLGRQLVCVEVAVVAVEVVIIIIIVVVVEVVVIIVEIVIVVEVVVVVVVSQLGETLDAARGVVQHRLPPGSRHQLLTARHPHTLTACLLQWRGEMGHLRRSVNWKSKKQNKTKQTSNFTGGMTASDPIHPHRGSTVHM